VKLWFYRFLVAVSARVGVWVIKGFAWAITAAHFVLLPKRVRHSVDFYAALLPDRSARAHRRTAWGQYQHFATVYSERLVADYMPPPRVVREGAAYFEHAIESGEGGVIVMSHVGNWEVAARTFARSGLRLLLYIDEEERNVIEDVQGADLAREGLTTVTVPRDRGDALNLVDAASFIAAGGFVGLPGDRLRPGGRGVRVRFAGRRTELPAAPHALALATGAPLLAFFALREAPGAVRVRCTPPQRVVAASRGERIAAIAESVQWYAETLEGVVREHPEQWHHFAPFFVEDDEATLAPAGR